VAGNPRIDELRKKLDKEPGSRLFAQLAEELRKDGDLEEAIQVAREGLQKHSNYPSARMTLGRALFDTGDWSAARAEFELVLKGAPDNILASRLLAESLESLGDIPAAIARYKKTLALAPGDKQVLARLDALEKGGAAVAVGAPPGAAAPAPPEPRAPIPVVAVDTPMELEQPHERATAFAPGPAAPPPPAAPSPPSSESPASVTPPSAPSEPAPIPLVAAEEDFELERPYEAPRTSGAAAPPAPAAAQARAPSAAPPVPRPSAEPPMMEFEFDAGPPGPTIPFAPAPAPAPVPAPAPAPALAESAPPTPVPPPPPAPAAVAAAAPPPVATPPPPAPAAPETRAALGPPPHSPVPPAAANTVEVAWAAPPPPASVAAPVPTFAPEPERQPAPPPPAAPPPAAAAQLPPSAPPAAAAPPPAPSPAPEAASGELMSATLAELYFKQGFADKAVEVYRQLIEREPENDRLRRRLAELQEPRLAPAPASHTGTDQASRRVALERTIAKLEGMLAAIKKG